MFNCVNMEISLNKDAAAESISDFLIEKLISY